MGTPGKPGTVSGGLCVCLADRTHAATPMGIQPVISLRIVDAILTLPEGYMRVCNVYLKSPHLPLPDRLRLFFPSFTAFPRLVNVIA